MMEMKPMKHIVKAEHKPEFFSLWDLFLQRLKETGQRIYQAKFVFESSLTGEGKFKAVVWTKESQND